MVRVSQCIPVPAWLSQRTVSTQPLLLLSTSIFFHGHGLRGMRSAVLLLVLRCGCSSSPLPSLPPTSSTATVAHHAAIARGAGMISRAMCLVSALSVGGLCEGWPIALAVGEPNRYPAAMPAHLRRFNEPGHVHFWTISCYRRLGFFHHGGMKRIVIAALKRLQAKFESPTAKAMGHPSFAPKRSTPRPSPTRIDNGGGGGLRCP